MIQKNYRIVAVLVRPHNSSPGMISTDHQIKIQIIIRVQYFQTDITTMIKLRKTT